jgi:hypothetical protein
LISRHKHFSGQPPAACGIRPTGRNGTDVQMRDVSGDVDALLGSDAVQLGRDTVHSGEDGDEAELDAEPLLLETVPVVVLALLLTKLIAGLAVRAADDDPPTLTDLALLPVVGIGSVGTSVNTGAGPGRGGAGTGVGLGAGKVS